MYFVFQPGTTQSSGQAGVLNLLAIEKDVGFVLLARHLVCSGDSHDCFCRAIADDDRVQREVYH